MIRTARESRVDIIENPIASDHRAIVFLVAQVRHVAPAIDVRLRDPQMISAETACGIAIAETHAALGHWLIFAGADRREA